MRDPHCAWELELQRCVHSREWTRGSYVQNILTGQSEQCPGFISADGSYKVEEDTPDGTGTGWMDSNVSASGDGPLDKLSFLYTPGGLSLVILAIVFALVIGFLVILRKF